MRNRIILAVSLISILAVIFGFKSLDNPVKVMSIGVIVSDLDESYKFYTEIIGMEQMGTYHQSSETSAKYGVNSGKEFDIIDLKLECDGYFLKYKLNKTKDNLPDKPFINEEEYYGFENIGTSYFSIGVKSVGPYIQRLEENNIKHKIATFPSGYKVVLLHDPDGVLLEIGGY